MFRLFATKQLTWWCFPDRADGGNEETPLVHRRVLSRSQGPRSLEHPCDRPWTASALCDRPWSSRLAHNGLPRHKERAIPLPKHSQTMLNMGSLRQIAKKKGKVLNALVIFENALCHQNVEHRFTVDQKWPERTWQSWASKCQAKCTSERWQVRRKDFIKIIVCWASAWQVQCCGTPQVFEFWCQKGLASPLFSAGRGAKPTQCILILELFIWWCFIFQYGRKWSLITND